MIESVKQIHIALAAVSFTGFAVRVYWSVLSDSKLENRLVRIAPHVIDSLLLASGIGLVVVSAIPLGGGSWLWPKLGGLVVYIVSGSIALKRRFGLRQRITAACVALLSFAYIVGVALNKSALSWLA